MDYVLHKNYFIYTEYIYISIKLFIHCHQLLEFLAIHILSSVLRIKCLLMFIYVKVYLIPT